MRSELEIMILRHRPYLTAVQHEQGNEQSDESIHDGSQANLRGSGK